MNKVRFKNQLGMAVRAAAELAGVAPACALLRLGRTTDGRPYQVTVDVWHSRVFNDPEPYTLVFSDYEGIGAGSGRARNQAEVFRVVERFLAERMLADRKRGVLA